MLSKISQMEKSRTICVNSYVGYKTESNNKQTRQTNKQKLIDTDNSMAVTREKGRWRGGRGEVVTRW